MAQGTVCRVRKGRSTAGAFSRRVLAQRGDSRLSGTDVLACPRKSTVPFETLERRDVFEDRAELPGQGADRGVLDLEAGQLRDVPDLAGLDRQGRLHWGPGAAAPGHFLRTRGSRRSESRSAAPRPRATVSSSRRGCSATLPCG